MHGTNPIRKLERNSVGESLQVREIFLTMQGEGPYAGRRAVFTRLSGCHLRCFYCDTMWSDSTDPVIHFESIAAQIMRLWYASPMSPNSDPLVVLTGGEPTRQNITQLVILLAASRCVIQIETAGSFWWDAMTHTQIVVSPKTSYVHPEVALRARAYKYIIRARDEFSDAGLPLSSTQEIGKLVKISEPPPHLPPSSVYVSPCDEGDVALNKANLDVCLKLVLERGYTLNLQQHKLVGLD